MSGDQTKDKRPLGKNNRDDRNNNRRPAEKPGNGVHSDPTAGQPNHGHDEEKANRIDYSQQIGEFSNWSRRS